MATIEKRIEHLFPKKKGKGPSPIAIVATLFAERRGQWLTQADVIRLVKGRFADSTARNAFKELSRPLASLNGHSFIDTDSIRIGKRGGPIIRGRLSEVAANKIFTLVTPVNQEPSSYFIREKRLELPPLQIGYKYISPYDIIDLRIQKCGEEYTNCLLNKITNDKPGSDRAAMQKLIEIMAEQQGIKFNAEADQFTKDGQLLFPEGDLARAHFEWKYKFHGIDEPYTKSNYALKTHHHGPIPKKWHTFTDLGMKKLASDENRAVLSASEYLVDSSEDDARVFAIEARAKRGDQEAFDELVQVLSSDESRYAREDAACSISRLHDARFIEPLVEAMLGDEFNGVRLEAVTALGDFGYRQEFAMALKDVDSCIRRNVAKVLGKLGDARAVEPLKEALKDSDIDMQRAIATALGAIGDTTASSFLISMLDCENESIRCDAAAALGNIEDPHAIPALRKICNDPSSRVRDASKKALEKLEEKDL
jgi:hypothetical protein